MRLARLRRAAPMLTLWTLAGCSLVTIKSPEVPLTPREQDARLLTRDYAAHFTSQMTHLIDEATRAEAEPAVRAQAVRLKLGVVTESTRAATGLSPIGSLLDSWAFAVQLRDFLASGPGSEIFGSTGADVRAGASQLADEADELARKVSGGDYARYKTFVARYAFRHPLENADCIRPSVLSTWAVEEKDPAPLRIVGTVAQALGDASDRMRIYSEQLPSIGLWQAERSLDRAGFEAGTYRAALRNIDAQLAKISTLADTSPALAREAIADLRSTLLALSDRMDNTWMETLRALRAEREALTNDIAAERSNLVAAADLERERVAEDASRIAARAVDSSWQELRKLVREALLLLSLLAVLVLGLPFAAGYLLGRHRRMQQLR